MINVVRRSQILGLMTMDSGSATRFDAVEEVWIDDRGRVTYLSGSQGYTPLEQVSVIGPDAVLTYSSTVVSQPTNLHRLYQLPVRSPMSDSLGWIEDFLFDWETGDIAAYILGGDIATSFGERAVLYPEDVEVIDAEAVVVREGAKERLKSESEGLKGFISEKSQQVRNLVKTMSDRLKSIVSPQDKPEVVRVKIKEVHDELEASGKHDKNILQQATQFLLAEWESFQESAHRAGDRVKHALDSAWKHLTKKQA
ncbi:PRC-barrel domain-containing protein [Fischerella sp. PCC 9605]|uniref:PRC-barrel domain-containing protein n=1 Tax=Fischerella sp. PCC 9605 TaxID=1173024 RepID=UPI00047A1153|nr:PRC-barrel domain-containing protein [Fischerella sp. PCC 9605]